MLRLLSSIGSAIGASWCKLMHPEPMWPVRGEYQCRVCQRKFRVAWEEPAQVKTPAPAQQPERIAPAAAATQSL